MPATPSNPQQPPATPLILFPVLSSMGLLVGYCFLSYVNIYVSCFFVYVFFLYELEAHHTFPCIFFPGWKAMHKSGGRNRWRKHLQNTQTHKRGNAAKFGVTALLSVLSGFGRTFMFDYIVHGMCVFCLEGFIILDLDNCIWHLEKDMFYWIVWWVCLFNASSYVWHFWVVFDEIRCSWDFSQIVQPFSWDLIEICFCLSGCTVGMGETIRKKYIEPPGPDPQDLTGILF